jgi:hypothetical protein
MIVVTIVVRRRSLLNNAAILGRFNVPASFACCHFGDSGRNGRIKISGMAGMSPDISVYRHAALPLAISPPKKLSHSGRLTAGSEAAHVNASPLAIATSSPPMEENA